MTKGFNQVFFLGYVCTKITTVQKKDLSDQYFDLTIMNSMPPHTKIRVRCMDGELSGAVKKLKPYDVIWLIGSLQKDHEDKLYVLLSDMIRLNTGTISEEKAIAKLLSHKDYSNLVFLDGDIENRHIRVRRMSQTKTFREDDLIETDESTSPIRGMLIGEKVVSKDK